MSYLFTCPHCKSQTLVGDEYSGLAGECAVCSKPVELPDFAGLGPVEQQVPQPWLSNRTVRLVIAGTVTLALAACLLFVFIEFSGSTLAQLQTNRRRQQDASNLQNIAKALNAYAADYGTYPPSVTADANGLPMHSWRVLILPYLGQDELYRQYDMKLPWDQNMNQMYTMPDVYQASTSQAFGFEPSYFLVTGPGTLFPTATTALGPGDVVDEPSKTILVVEALSPMNSLRHWMEPVDLDIRKMQLAIAGNDGIEIGGGHEGGAMVATMDERGHFLRDTLSPVEVRALLSPAGGEPLADDILD